MSAGIVILASGEGTLAQAVFDAVSSHELDVKILEVITDRPQAPVLDRARKSGLQTYIHPMMKERQEWDTHLLRHINLLNPDLVVSLGFMRILSPAFVSRFKIINSHPALLPAFPGAHAVRDALAAGVRVSGASVHWVDAGVDSGEVIAQQAVEVLPGESEDSLHTRIKIVEQGLIVATIKTLLPNLESHRV